MTTEVLQRFEVRHTCEDCGLQDSKIQFSAAADTTIPHNWDYRFRFEIGREWDAYMKMEYTFEQPIRMLCCPRCKSKHPTWNDLLAQDRHKARYISSERG